MLVYKKISNESLPTFPELFNGYDIVHFFILNLANAERSGLNLATEEAHSLVSVLIFVSISQPLWANPAANSTSVRVGLPDMPFLR